ncbi:MAG TPA: NAD-dependent epimerase/dehydratase family protein [Candidatus Dormibacteraeota bacterium]|nr:NAD-dependent epimerase/dehydratase family protein [Candidatus Dormibacteraeota bacterium]
MRIAVLGGTGFIGPFVVRRLAEAGHRVTVVHRGVTERDDLGAARHVHAERADFAAAMDAVGDVDVALDMAPFTEAAARTALAAVRGHCPRLVAVSSVDVYRAFGALNRLEDSPLPEPPVDEDAPLRTVLHPYRNSVPAGGPEWLRDYDKIPVERLVMSDAEIAGTVLRLGAVYGPGDQQHRLLPLVARVDARRPALLLEPTQAACRWPYVYVENAAAAIAAAVVDPRAAGRIYNVGPPLTPTNEEWTRRVAEALGWNGRIVMVPDGTLDPALGGMPDADLRHHVDVVSTRIREELDLEDPVDFATGVRRTAEYERAFLGGGGSGPSLADYAREDAILAAKPGP